MGKLRKANCGFCVPKIDHQCSVSRDIGKNEKKIAAKFVYKLISNKICLFLTAISRRGKFIIFKYI